MCKIPETVKIPTRDYEMGKYPVTFEEYDAFCEATGREKPDDKGWGRGQRPVINVTWHDAQAYVEWLRQETGENFSLPSEEQWEHACRAGTSTAYNCGDNLSSRDANFGNNIGRTTPVDTYPPNAWGLCDMHGNVWEWASDEWEN